MFVDSIWTRCPSGATLLFSAHGVSPEIRRLARERKLRAIDATCPLVTKVHLEAIRFAKEGYTILLIGHEGHDEVIGTMGEAPQAIVLVESVEACRTSLNSRLDAKLAYLTQTTLSVDDANRIINRLKERFPQIVGPPKEDICYATQNRQEAIRSLTAEAELVLGAWQPEQFKQPATERDCARKRCSREIDRWGSRHRRCVVHRRRNGRDHRRGQRPGIGRGGVRRVSPQPLRRHGGNRTSSRGRRSFPVAARTADDRSVR